MDTDDKPWKTFFLFFIAVCFTQCTFCQVNLNNGLVAHLPFNSNTSDVSGNNNNGVATNGPTLTSDRFGNVNSAYLLDGVNDYIRVPDPLRNFSGTPFSVVLWFQPLSTNFQVLIGKREYGTTNGQQFQLSVFRPSPAGLFSSITSDKIPCIGNIDNSVLSMTNYSPQLCLSRWYCVIVTFDGTTHKMYLDNKLVSQNNPNFSKMLSCPSDIRLGNWWSGDPLSFNGKLDDFRWYSRVVNSDEIAALSVNSAQNSGSSNFDFNQQLCAPLSFQFNASSTQFNSFNWNFDDGTPANTNQHPVHNFAAQGDYMVQMVAGSGACSDTVRKLVRVNFFEDEIINYRDTVICLGSEITLRSDSAAEYCWGPSNVVVSNVFREITVKPTQQTTYTLHTLKAGANLISNGSFENGTPDFPQSMFIQPQTPALANILLGRTQAYGEFQHV